MRKIIYPSLALVFLLLQYTRSLSQPFTLNDSIQPIELNMIDYKKTDTLEKGKINVTQVTQTKDTMYFFVKGLSIYSPVYFSITTPEGAADNIKVNLNKDNWVLVNQSGETGEKGHWETGFKTEGDFGIMVIPQNKPADYSLLVWVGDEARDVGVTSPFKEGSVSVSNKNGSFFKKNLVYIIIGVLVLLVAYLLIKLKRNKK